METKERQLRILYLTHYFPPEVNAPAVRVSQFATAWMQAGHQVTIVTGFPNHPTGVIPEEYRGKAYQREEYQGVAVHRSFVYAAPNKGFGKRIANYLSFMVSAIWVALTKTGKQDVVIATSPQFFVAVAGFVVSLCKRIPFVFEVRDLWPEEIVAVGAMKRGTIIRMLEAVEMFLYRRAKTIVAVAQGTVDDLVARGIPKEKLVLIPNGVDYERFASATDDHTIRDEHELNGHFLVSYIGTMGMAHNLRTVIKAADRLKENDAVRFLFVGDGAERDGLMNYSRELGLENVTFVHQQPRNRIPEYYAASDLCLVPLRRVELFTKNIPSKIYEVMAAGKPIVIGTTGESQRLVESAQAGVAFVPDDDADLADKIGTLAADREKSLRLGANGQRFALQHCHYRRHAENYLDSLRAAVGIE